LHKVIVKLSIIFELTQKICSASQSLFVQINSKVPQKNRDVKWVMDNVVGNREDNKIRRKETEERQR